MFTDQDPLVANTDLPVTLTLENDDLTVTDLKQSGDRPNLWKLDPPVLGPAGIIASDGQGTLWFGVPVQ